MALRVYVCEYDDLTAGQPRGFHIRGVTWPVMIAIVDGEVVAFPGVCPHDDVSLIDYGVLDHSEMVCRVHGYRFDLRSGRCAHAPGLHLRRYRVTRIGSALWVDLL